MWLVLTVWSRQFDTPCIFSRDIADFGRIVSAWYGEKLRPMNETVSLDHENPSRREKMSISTDLNTVNTAKLFFDLSH
jgi:hypothetical protein